jgi:hypothetical protein
MKGNCNYCNRPLGDGTGGYQTDKTCKGDCMKNIPPPPPSPKIKK